MAILAECPMCHEKQSVKRKFCKCGADMDKQKRAKKVRYWIKYRLPDGTQRKEPVGKFDDCDPYSIENARACEAKRTVQKKENRIFDILPESQITFKELTDWHTGLDSVKKLASFGRVKIALNHFNAVFGEQKVNDVLPVDLENYQAKREEDGLAPATIDMEICIAQTMVVKGFDNDRVDGRAVKSFRRIKRKLRKGTNARKRIVSMAEYLGLTQHALPHLKPILTMAWYTGMRRGELRNLRWEHIDRKNGFIGLPAGLTKEKAEKNIPINHHVAETLNTLPRSITGYVFTYQGKPIRNVGGLKKSFDTACRESGIPYGRKVQNGVTFHDIRRTVKTNMLNAGVDKVHRDMILGHSLDGMDVHYLVGTDAALKGAMEKYTKWIDTQIEAERAKSESDSQGFRNHINQK